MAQLDDVLALVARTLGDDVRSVILYGSAVHGGLHPDSDLDLLVVLVRPLRAEERRALVDGLLSISGRDRRMPGDRWLELTCIALGDVVPWRYPPVMDFQYGDWLRPEVLAGALPERHARPDLAILLTMARTWGRALAGDPPRAVLPDIPSADLRRAIVDELPSLLADLETDTRNVLLTLARAWVTLATGEIVAKDVAADRAMAALDPVHGPVLAHARAIYLGEVPERWEGSLAAGVRPAADALQAAIGRGRPRG